MVQGKAYPYCCPQLRCFSNRKVLWSDAQYTKFSLMIRYTDKGHLPSRIQLHGI